MKNSYEQRLATHQAELARLYSEVYALNPFYEVHSSFHSLLKLMDSYHKQRKETYKKADRNDAAWFFKHDIVGTTLYVDLFSKDLSTMHQYIPYFKELGISFIHFMPLLEGREGENDGGYAVKDYKSIDSKFGSNEDFYRLCEALKEEHIHVCIDFVVNHTAKEHEFAKKAFAGNKKYQDMYFMYDNDSIPREFDKTVPQVFPNVSPGNFTYYDEIKKWVFTSFYEFQWDLNYQNPYVFECMIDILLHLANHGVDMIRLDAIPFMWKEIGTTCRNHPIIHKLLRMFHLITEIVCPSVALLGEAIVEPEEIVGYFGRESEECDLMYNATHMVNIWNSIATRDTRLLQIDTKRLKAPGHGCWINYARCHDDIGWGFNEEATRSMGFDPIAHKQFLIHFYLGDRDDSFSVGELYEFHEETGDARNCGTMASLCGLEKALHEKDGYAKELALKRIMLIHNLLIASAGIPLIYSGDEIASMNNYEYLQDSKKAHDSRWMHRGHFRHDLAALRNDLSSPEAQIFQSLKKAIEVRRANSLFSPLIAQEIIDTGNLHIYAFYKEEPNKASKAALFLFNFSEDRQFIGTWSLPSAFQHKSLSDLLTGKLVATHKEQIVLGPYEALWLS